MKKKAYNERVTTVNYNSAKKKQLDSIIPSGNSGFPPATGKEGSRTGGDWVKRQPGKRF